MKKQLLFLIVAVIFGCSLRYPVTPTASDLQFSSLATVWDEAMPLGNADVGALIWQKGNALRFSLDRIDLWDLRPMDSLQKVPTYSFEWITRQVNKGDLRPIQEKFEKPYDALPGPSKIPGGALEFDTKSWGRVANTRLYLKNALCVVEWENGTSLKTFIQANEPVGWFVFDNVADNLAVLFKNKGKLRNKVGMISHFVYKIMLIGTGLINIPERLSGEFFYCSVVIFSF
mgnify:CR=1 FL=1